MAWLEDWSHAQMLQQAHQRELELLVSMLVVKYGQPIGTGHQLAIPEEEALELRSQLPPRDPAVIYWYDQALGHFVVNVI